MLILKRLAPSVLAAAPLLLAPSASFADLVSVSQNGATGTRDCAGGDARIDGNSNNLSLKNCATVIVAGNSNDIDAGAATALSVSGNDNHVTWGGARPRINDVGSRNVIKPSAGRVEGPNSNAKVKVGSDTVGVDAGGAHVTMGPGGISINDPSGQVDMDAGGVSVNGAISRVSVTTSGIHRTYDCKGQHASVSGDRNVLTFRNCTAVNVSGDDIEIYSGTAARVNLSGDRNRVHHPTGTSPRVSDTGSENVVTEDQ
jgi:hypothetical protein